MRSYVIFTSTLSSHPTLGLSTSERRKYGLQAKNILDYARCAFLMKRSLLRAYFTKFVNFEDTYENVAIVASRVFYDSDSSEDLTVGYPS